MLLELIMVLSASMGIAYSDCDLSNSAIKSDDYLIVDELSDEQKTTYDLNDGTYISFFHPFAVHDVKEQVDRGIGNFLSINSKYVQVGVNSYYTGTTVIAGEEPFSFLPGTSIEYISFLEFDLSSFPDYSIILESGFTINKTSGSLTSLYCYQINNCLFSNITGTSTYSKSYVDSCMTTFNSFTFDITDAVIDRLSNSYSTLIVSLEGNESHKLANFNVDINGNAPSYFVRYGYYGSATPYVSNSNPNVNCLGYAKSNSGWYDISNELSYAFGSNVVDYSLLSTAGLNVIKNNFGSTKVRLLDSYDASISSGERRIAFRVQRNNNGTFAGGFHFMRQCSDGNWAEKLGSGDSGICPNWETGPEYDSNWYNGTYTSDTLYFAYLD